MSSIVLVGVELPTSAISVASQQSININLLAVDQLFSWLADSIAVDLVVMGRDVSDPVRLAQRIHALNIAIPLVVLCHPQRLEQVKQAFRFAPLLGSDIVCEPALTANEISGILQEHLDRIQRRQQYRSTVASLNTRLQASPAQQQVAEQYMNRLLDVAPIGIIHLDDQGHILTWNQKAAQLLRKTEREVLGTPLTHFFESGSVHALLEQAIASQKEVINQVVKRHNPTHETQFMAISIAPLLIPGKAQSAIVLLEDITQRVLAEKARDELLILERQARQIAEAGRQRFALLAEIGIELNRELQYETMLSNMAHIMLATLADWCMIDLVNADNVIERVTVAASNPDKQALLEEMQVRFPPSWDSPQPSVQALHTQKPIFMPVMSKEIMVRRTYAAEHLELIQALAPISSIAVPLIARNRVIGAVTVARTPDSGQFYSEEDLVLLQQIAQRAALTVDNGRLYQEANFQRERLQVTLASIGDGVIATDRDGHITFMNPVAEAITGWDSSEVIGQPVSRVFNIINEFTREPVESPIDKVLQQGTVIGLANHTLLITKDGQEKPIADSGAPIRNLDESIVGTVLVFRDVTEEKTSERLLQERQQFIERMTYAIPDIVYVYDIAEYRQVYANREQLRTLGYTTDDINQMGAAIFEEIIHPEDRELVQQRPQQYATIGEDDVFELEYRIRHKNGQWRWLSTRSTIFQRGADGIPRQILGIAQDITARKQAEERLLHLQQITTLLSGAVTLEQVLNIIVEQALASMNVRAGIVFLVNEDSQTLSIVNSYRVSPSVLERFSKMLSTKDFVVAQAFSTGQAQWIEDRQVIAMQYPGSYELTLEVGSKAIAALPLTIEGQIIGGLTIHFSEKQTFGQTDKDYLLALAHQCAQAINRAQLAAQAQAAAAFEERQRLARDLHDAVSQTLFSATVTAEALPKLWERNPQRALEKLEQVVQLNSAAMAEMRTLLLELRPDVIVNNYLDVLLKQLVTAAKGRRKIKTELELNTTNVTLPPDVHISFYRIAQEAIHNIMKHSRATQFKVQFSEEDSRIILYVEDNGIGFDSATISAGLGLNTMRERANLIGANIKFNSQVGSGTSVTLEWKHNS